MALKSWVPGCTQQSLLLPFVLATWPHASVSPCTICCVAGCSKPPLLADARVYCCHVYTVIGVVLRHKQPHPMKLRGQYLKTLNSAKRVLKCCLLNAGQLIKAQFLHLLIGQQPLLVAQQRVVLDLLHDVHVGILALRQEVAAQAATGEGRLSAALYHSCKAAVKEKPNAAML